MSESLDRPVLLSAASNQAVVQLPGRRFPGSVIQGDSLSYLYVLACAVENHAVDTPNDALIEAARELRELLEGLSAGPVIGIGLLFMFFVMLVVGTTFGMFGGLFGALMFRKTPPPVIPPPIPPTVF